ncbi:MAG: hypothetical protein LBR83_06775 [Clostridiales bacterium]|jgi:hypothetical protein|nr:hypothetical protein [Clostridiales bacterium]
MGGVLFDATKKAAYFLWEYTGCASALNLWLCAEDMACFFEQHDILNGSRVEAVRRKSVEDPGYIQFVQHVAFRIYIYTNMTDEFINWCIAERLIANDEWVTAMTEMASVYRKEKSNQDVMSDVRSENVRAFYDEQTIYNR